ncbi:hypothetical protein OIU34_31245 [Pararhizobium sp. BT-229]|uniref:hypothetical protein n=1 Tax=Pararhizobium sp. BT-229 TaxID=2986923 RepID=UPI0021F75A27|nr:hypothetical protein [Pararhizobium sp. BT-229]MCV9966352.1 hypothetical protein [Pararhizobium sp. BT-229]
MKITWKNIDGTEHSERIEAALRPYVDCIGIDLAAKLFQALGGSNVYIPGHSDNNRSHSLVRVIGAEAVQALATTFRDAGRTVRLPLANVFLARYFRSQDLTTNEIARVIRVSDVAVRAALLPNHVRRAKSEKTSRKRHRDELENMKAIAQAEMKPVKRVTAVQR